MRVAVDCHMVAQPSPGDAGNARYAASLARSMAETASAADHVTALVARREAWGAVGRISSAPVPANDLWRLARGASSRLAALDADLASFTYIAPPNAPCPVMLSVHDATFVTDPGWLGQRARTMLRSLVPRSARAAGAVLTLSETARDDVGAALGLDPDRVRVVSPFPSPEFRPLDGAEERVRRQFGLRRYVLAVGDVGPRKNLPALGAAIDELDDPGLELALVGRPGHGGDEIAARTGGRWLGHVDDAQLADLYRAAAVTAYPSLYEGFGLPLLEAMACGCPVVASRRGALPEVAGDAAILTEPAPGAIAEGLRAALEPATADRLRASGPARAARYTAAGMGEAAWGAAREALS